MMRRLILALALPLVWVATSRAQLNSPIDLVKGLREAGLTDLALEKLNELKQKPVGLSKDEILSLPLEIARTHLEQATRETEDGKRAGLVALAQGEFDDFIKANPTHPKAVQANIEIARLISINAKGQLAKARRFETKDARAVEFSKVRPEFDKAIGRFKGAMTAIENRLKSMDAKDPVAIDLQRSLLQATLDSGILTFEKAKTFIGDGEAAKELDEITKAQKIFAGLSNRYGNERIGYLATVWQTHCDFEINERAKAAKTMDTFVQTNRGNREAFDAVRQAQFFQIEHLDRSEAKDNASLKLRVEAAATEWLRKYPEYRNSREGLRARYLYLALAQQDRARAGIKFDAKTGRATSISSESRVLLESANRIYSELAETENEYSDRAANFRLRNIVALLDAAGGGKETPISAIRTLEQGFLAAQVQQARILQMKEKPESGGKINLEDPKDPKMPKDAPKGKEPAKQPDPKANPKQADPKTSADLSEADRVKLAIGYLERGLSLVTSKDSPREILNAQLLLSRFLWEANRHSEAAVICEALARNNAKVTRAAFAAQLAIDSYNSSLAKHKETGNSTEESVAADLNRIRSLGEFAEKNWPNEPATDGVRQSLAFYLNQDKNYEGAVTTLSRISDAYPNLYQVRLAQASALYFLVTPPRNAKQYQEELKKNITARSALWSKTMSQLEAIPEPPASIDSTKGSAYLLSRIILAQLYFMAGDYAKCEASVKATIASTEKLTNLDPAKKKDMTADARVQYFNSLSGRAAELIKAKEFAKVQEVLGADIASASKELQVPSTGSASSDRLRIAQRAFILNVMTANVQDKKVDKASELLEVLQSGGGTIESNIAVMQQLVSSIRGQIQSLKKESKADEAKELSESFTQFLDKISSNPKLPNSAITFLGNGYQSVDQHVKAIKLYEDTLAKAFENTGKTDAEKKELEKSDSTFRKFLQVELVRSLRTAGGEENFKKANQLMKEIVGDPIKKGVNRGWGYANIAIRKEYIYLLEAQSNYRDAVGNWTQLSREFVPTLPQPPKDSDKDGAQKAAKRQLFFDLNYEAQRTSAKAYASLDLKKAGKDQAFVDGKLADIGQKLFALLEGNKDIGNDVREKIMALINEYPQIKKKYDELAGTSNK